MVALGTIALVRYNVRGDVLYHERFLAGYVAPDVWVIVIPERGGLGERGGHCRGAPSTPPWGAAGGARVCTVVAGGLRWRGRCAAHARARGVVGVVVAGRLVVVCVQVVAPGNLQHPTFSCRCEICSPHETGNTQTVAPGWFACFDEEPEHA